MPLGFQDGLDSHDCDKLSTTELPTRLLDLQVPDHDSVKLMETQNAFPEANRAEPVRYAALSYC